MWLNCGSRGSNLTNESVLLALGSVAIVEGRLRDLDDHHFKHVARVVVDGGLCLGCGCKEIAPASVGSGRRTAVDAEQTTPIRCLNGLRLALEHLQLKDVVEAIHSRFPLSRAGWVEGLFVAGCLELLKCRLGTTPLESSIALLSQLCSFARVTWASNVVRRVDRF